MAKKYLILFFICLFSCVMGYFEPEPKIKIEVQKESPAFDKINAIQCILNRRSDESFSDSKLKNEDNVDRKLDFLQKQISELKDILIVAELKRISDLEENVKLILDLVQKISKIEDRFSEKLDSSEKKLMSKLSDLEKMPALEPTTKTVENIGKIPECTNKTKSQLEYLEKFPEFQENINRTLYSIEKVSESTEKSNHKLDLLTKRVTESDKNTNEKLGAIEKIFEPIEQINRKLDALNNKILPELEENVTSTMNITEEVPVSTDIPNHALYSLVNKMPELDQNINGTLVIIETSAESSENVDDLEKEVPDLEIKVDKNLELSSYNPSADHAGIGTSANQKTLVATSLTSAPPVKTVHTPNVLSPDHFEYFYIKISDCTLSVGKEGESTPLITYNDSHVSTINYFSFTHWSDKEAEFLIDCLPSTAFS